MDEIKIISKINDTLDDPYNNSLYQANMVKQEKRVFLQTKIDSSMENIKTQIHVEITLVHGGIDVLYNPNIVKFEDSENEIVFRREINSFFSRIGFSLNRIFFPISVYKCGTREVDDIVQFIFYPNEIMISDEETHSLNLIISNMLVRSNSIHPQEDVIV